MVILPEDVPDAPTDNGLYVPALTYRVSPALTPEEPQTMFAGLVQAFDQDVPLLEPVAAVSKYQFDALAEQDQRTIVSIIKINRFIITRLLERSVSDELEGC